MPGYAIDRMCAGAMTAVTTTAGGIAFGAYDIAIAGGVEHMGRHPMGEGVDPNPRFISREAGRHRPRWSWASTAENLHDRFPDITKERADAYALASQHKVAKAYANGKIQPDLVAGRPSAAPSGAGAWPPRTSRRARTPRWRGWPTLKTPFRPHGRGHRGQLGRPERRRHRLPPGRRGRRRASWACRSGCGWSASRFAGVEPEVMGIGPIPATEKAAGPAGLTIDDIGLFELNEAFAVQVLAFLDHFGIADDDPRVNPYGGAIALGHPLASSGVRLMTQLARQFAEHPEVRYGLTAMCIGLGMGGTVIWENPQPFEGGK